ncbi:MAG: 4-hydroxy-tetrahydrodipicolinate reductase [Chloroflexi bacterium]|nr:MAG: 4-hydroxy-tetrahydrodipicolinate reductase [Chloroflexota bacterium]
MARSAGPAPLRVAVSGARGRAGREIVAALNADPGFVCAAEIEEGDDIAAALRSSSAQALVDFTTPAAGLGNALAATDAGVAPVVGTTGLGESAVARVREACAAAGVGGCVAANFSLGAVLLMWLSELASSYFERCEIIEAHHAGKIDAPSGTALRTAELMLAARDGRRFDHSRAERETLAGTRGGEFGGAAVHSVRLDGVVADQSVTFATAGQTLTIEHRTTSRAAFAPGVLLAVRAVLETGRFFDGLAEVLRLPANSAIRGLMSSSTA